VDSGARFELRAEKAALALLVLIVLLSLGVLVHPWYDPRNDASMYILTARSLAEGEGYSYLGAPFLVRPPGFSAILAPVVGVLGTDFFALNFLVSLFGAAGVLLLFLQQRARVGWLLGALTALAVWLNPGYQRMCNEVMSDVPGVALLLLCLLVERWASRTPSWRCEVLLGACIGLSAYVRSAVVLLVPAIVVSRLISEVRDAGRDRVFVRFAARRLALFALTAWLLVLPWSVRNARSALPAPVDQVLNYSISTAMWHKDPGDPNSPRLGAAEILTRLPANLRPMSSVLGSRMQQPVPGEPPGLGREILHAVVSLLLLASLVTVLLQRRAAPEIYTACLLPVLAFYFAFTDRLVLPIYVIAFAAFVEVLYRILRRAAGDRTATVAAGAIVLLLVAMDFAPRRGWREIEARHRAYTEIASSLKSRLGPETRLASAQGYHYAVYLDRPVYSLIPAIRRAGRNEAAEGILDKYGIESVVLSPLDNEYRAVAPYFEQRYGSGERVASATVWRVRRATGDIPATGDAPGLPRRVPARLPSP
jgi:hypothetical protein